MTILSPHYGCFPCGYNFSAEPRNWLKELLKEKTNKKTVRALLFAMYVRDEKQEWNPRIFQTL